jgi:hypothetical protein
VAEVDGEAGPLSEALCWGSELLAEDAGETGVAPTWLRGGLGALRPEPWLRSRLGRHTRNEVGWAVTRRVSGRDPLHGDIRHLLRRRWRARRMPTEGKGGAELGCSAAPQSLLAFGLEIRGASAKTSSDSIVPL